MGHHCWGKTSAKRIITRSSLQNAVIYVPKDELRKLLSLTKIAVVLIIAAITFDGKFRSLVLYIYCCERSFIVLVSDDLVLSLPGSSAATLYFLNAA